eukprot:COSAG02_NODE_21082_length_803_cov_0.811080_1_plen_91_part_00
MAVLQNGALWLPHAFRFLTNFGKENENPTRTGFQPYGAFDYGTPDGYEFYLNMGPVRHAYAMVLEAKQLCTLCRQPTSVNSTHWQTPIAH